MVNLVKNWQFFNFFYFRQCRSGKCVLQYSRRKKRLIGQENVFYNAVEEKNAFPRL